MQQAYKNTLAGPCSELIDLSTIESLDVDTASVIYHDGVERMDQTLSGMLASFKVTDREGYMKWLNENDWTPLSEESGFHANVVAYSSTSDTFFAIAMCESAETQATFLQSETYAELMKDGASVMDVESVQFSEGLIIRPLYMNLNAAAPSKGLFGLGFMGL